MCSDQAAVFACSPFIFLLQSLCQEQDTRQDRKSFVFDVLTFSQPNLRVSFCWQQECDAVDPSDPCAKNKAKTKEISKHCSWPRMLLLSATDRPNASNMLVTKGTKTICHLCKQVFSADGCLLSLSSLKSLFFRNSACGFK